MDFNIILIGYNSHGRIFGLQKENNIQSLKKKSIKDLEKFILIAPSN